MGYSGNLLEEPQIQLPLHYTKAKNNLTRGEDITDFSETVFVASRGFRQGEQVEFADWQRWLVDAVFEEKEDGYWRYRTVVIGMARKNGKSFLGSAIALHHLYFASRGDQIFSAARSKEQAKVVFNETKAQVLASPFLRRRLRCYTDYIENKATGAIYRAVSSDGLGAHGTGPYVVIVDELHGFDTKAQEELWEALTSGSGDRPESIVIAITTAGQNVDSLLGQLYQRGKRVASGKEIDDSFGFFWWEVPEEDDITSPEVWTKANPNIAENLMDEDYMEGRLKASMNNINRFKQLHCNQWARTGGTGFVFPSIWDRACRLGASIPAGATIYAGFDGSNNDDSTVITGLDANTGLLQVLYHWDKDPNDPAWMVNRAEVNAAIHEMFATYNVRMLHCDPAFYRTDVEEWANKYPAQVEQLPNSIARMVPITSQMITDLASSVITHSGDEYLSSHFANAIMRDSGMIAKETRQGKRKIDAAVASILALSAKLTWEGRYPQGTGQYRIVTLG